MTQSMIALSLGRSQRGVVLIVSLIFLLLLSLLGLSSIQSATLQEQMVGNQRDHDMAFQAAEAALRWAENRAQEGATTDDKSWTPETNELDTYALDDTRLNSNPQYHIWHPDGLEGRVGEGENGNSPLLIYQITAVGYGGSPNSRVVLQSWYVSSDN